MPQPMIRLPGRSLRKFGGSPKRYQLWLTPEYLLFREIASYRESVKRYYYSDIQAIVSGPTRHAQWCTIISGVLFLVFGGLGAYVLLADYYASAVALAIFPLALAAIALLILLGNLFLGPTCKTTLYTATSEARLYSLGRQRSAARAMDRLLPYIEAAQGREAAPDQAVEPEITG